MSDLFVDSWGTRTPVVLVHGSLATGAEEWQGQRPLADGGPSPPGARPAWLREEPAHPTTSQRAPARPVARSELTLISTADRQRAQRMETPTLYIFSGLPGSGKSTVAQLLAVRVGAAYVRIDTIEQALREVCSIDVQGEGYRLAYRVTADNLRLGISVVADSCNPLELTRREWERVARDTGASFVNIEVVCSDPH